MDRYPETAPALPRPRPDGTRTRVEPKKFGKIDNHRQQPWKAPLPQFIEDLCLKRLGRPRPDGVMSIEEAARRSARRKAQRRAGKAVRNTGE
jgi:hypothetical protein